MENVERKMRLLSDQERNFVAENRIGIVAELLAEERYKRMVAERALHNAVFETRGYIAEARKQIDAELEAKHG